MTCSRARFTAELSRHTRPFALQGQFWTGHYWTSAPVQRVVRSVHLDDTWSLKSTSNDARNGQKADTHNVTIQEKCSSSRSSSDGDGRTSNLQWLGGWTGGQRSDGPSGLCRKWRHGRRSLDSSPCVLRSSDGSSSGCCDDCRLVRICSGRRCEQCLERSSLGSRK